MKREKEMRKSYQFLGKIFGVKINVWSLFTFGIFVSLCAAYSYPFHRLTERNLYTCIRQTKIIYWFRILFFFSVWFWFFFSLSFSSLDRYELTVDGSIHIWMYFNFSVFGSHPVFFSTLISLFSFFRLLLLLFYFICSTKGRREDNTKKLWIYKPALFTRHLFSFHISWHKYMLYIHIIRSYTLYFHSFHGCTHRILYELCTVCRSAGICFFRVALT